MKRLKINGLEINRINDKSVGKWNQDDILLTNKNPLIPVTIPTFEWNVVSPMLTPEEFNSLALIIPERFLNYINVTYSDITNVKIANITAKEGYVITKGQTEYRKVYNLYSDADYISISGYSKAITPKDLVDMFPSMLGSDGYLTYNAEAVNYLNSLKTDGSTVTFKRNYTKWKDNALNGFLMQSYIISLTTNESWPIPNRGTGLISSITGSLDVTLRSDSTDVLHIPYINAEVVRIYSKVPDITGYDPTVAIPTIFSTTIASSIKNVTIYISGFTKDEYYSTKYYDSVKNRIKPGTGQTVTLHFSDGNVVIN